MIFNLESNTQLTKSSVGTEKDTFRLTLGLKTYTSWESWRGTHSNERANVTAANSPFLLPGGSDLLLPQLPHPRPGGGGRTKLRSRAVRSVGSARLRDSPGQMRHLVPSWQQGTRTTQLETPPPDFHAPGAITSSLFTAAYDSCGHLMLQSPNWNTRGIQETRDPTEGQSPRNANQRKPKMAAAHQAGEHLSSWERDGAPGVNRLRLSNVPGQLENSICCILLAHL